MTLQEIRKNAKEILAQMGGNAHEICSGSCPAFAKRLVDQVGGEIVSNLSQEMMSELDGYQIIAPEAYIPAPSVRNLFSTSHCWVKVGGMFFDAFNPEGVSDETDLEFFENI
jgi:hypothetical protein